MLRRFTSERIRKARRQRLAFTSGVWCALVVAICFLFVQLVNLPELRITHISFTGNRGATHEELFNRVAPLLEGSYWHLFSKQNTFIFPQEEITKALHESFVRIERVRIEREGMNGIRIHIDERDATALWCPPPPTARSCYFVDDNGLAFAVAPRMSGGSFIVYERALPAEVFGMHVSDPAHIRELMSALEFMMTLGVTPERVVWMPDALGVHVRVARANGDHATRVVIPLTGPYERALNNLSSVVADFNFSDVEYIDVRFENKVFYKEVGTRSDGPEGEETETGE